MNKILCIIQIWAEADKSVLPIFVTLIWYFHTYSEANASSCANATRFTSLFGNLSQTLFSRSSTEFSKFPSKRYMAEQFNALAISKRMLLFISILSFSYADMVDFLVPRIIAKSSCVNLAASLAALIIFPIVLSGSAKIHPRSFFLFSPIISALWSIPFFAYCLLLIDPAPPLFWA